MTVIDVKPTKDKSADPNEGYHIRKGSDPAFFPGRTADIICNGKVIGHMGVIHPEVLGKFELANPCAALEISIEHFL